MSITRKYAWIRDTPDARDRLRTPAPARLDHLPSKVDLRENPAMPPVYDQEQIGSCTANAIAAAYEFELRQQGLPDFTPSRLFVYYNERDMEGSVDSDAGAQIRDGIKSIAKQGVVPEDVWPYDGTPSNPDGSWPEGHRAAQQPGDELYTQALEHQSLIYERVVQDEAHIKAALADGNLVVYGFTVYESFESQEVAETGKVPMPEPGEAVLGGHAVALVGYDDATGEYLGRNSWGKKWGMAGYYRKPYGFLHNRQLCSDLWVVKKVEG